MQTTSVFEVYYLTGKIHVLHIFFEVDNLDAVILTDTEIIGITANRHFYVPHATHFDEPLKGIHKTLYLNKSVIDHLFKTNKQYVGFQDGLNYEFYNSEDELPNPCLYC